MGLKSQVTSILNRFTANFSGVPVKYSNFETVTNGAATLADPSSLPEWVEFHVIPNITRQMDLNAVYWKKTDGIISANVWVRADTGVMRAWEIADLVTAIYARKRFDGILVSHEEVNDLGEIDGFYGIGIVLPYSAYETAAA